MKKVSIKDIAEKASLSKTTVSWILNGKGKEKNIKESTIERVLDIAKAFNYTPNYLAQSLSLGRSNSIGLIIPRITDSFFAGIAEILEREASKAGYTIVYGSSGEDKDREHALINSFLHKQVDGLIIASSQYNQVDIQRLISASFPFVLIDRCYPELNTNSVAVENKQGAYALVSHLVKSGRKRIALVTASSHLHLMQDRAAGYKDACTNNAIEVDVSLTKVVDLSNEEESVHAIIKSLLEQEQSIDAIFFTTHYLATLGFKYLRYYNVAIPADVAICCFGDSPFLDILQPAISAIPMPTELMAENALRMLLSTIDDKSALTEQLALPVTPVIRQSSL